MDEILVFDHQIISIYGNKKDSCAGIVYKDKAGFHKIDFAVCANNCCTLHPSASGKCIGERNIEDFYFLIYTSGVPTKIVFKKKRIFGFFGGSYFIGLRSQRFYNLQKLILEADYTTYDLT